MHETHHACRWLWTLAVSAICLGCQPSPEVRPDPTPRRAPAQAMGAHAPSIIHSAPWGSDPGQFGHLLPTEGAPEGPMSLTTNAQGELFVLDQVNARVQVLSPEGAFLRSIPIPSTTVQDLVVTGLGEVVLLDRLAEPGLIFIDDQGKLRARVKVVGHGVAEGGAITALVEHEGAIWVEVDRAMTVRIADWQAVADPDRISVDGRPSRKGGAAWQVRLRDGAVRLRGQPRTGTAMRRSLSFALPVMRLSTLDTDETGNVFVSAHLAKESEQPPFAVTEDKDVLSVFNAKGDPLGSVELESSTGPEEQFRAMTVARDGTVYHLQCTVEGTVLRRWRP
ncbi:MAG: hypothetical protein HY898_04220 [Deltaproteobacteria bacterium]|nr:hypothetical protein [Deltaproteobacteria bacterium]